MRLATPGEDRSKASAGVNCSSDDSSTSQVSVVTEKRTTRHQQKRQHREDDTSDCSDETLTGSAATGVTASSGVSRRAAAAVGHGGDSSKPGAVASSILLKRHRPVCAVTAAAADHAKRRKLARGWSATQATLARAVPEPSYLEQITAGMANVDIGLSPCMIGLLTRVSSDATDAIRGCLTYYQSVFRSIKQISSVCAVASIHLQVLHNRVDTIWDLYRDGRISICHLLLSLFLLASRGKVFKRNRVAAHSSVDLTHDHRAMEASHWPAFVQLRVLRLVTPLLSCLLGRALGEQPLLLLHARTLVDDFCEDEDRPATPPATPPASIRLPGHVRALALDLDDTLFLHTHVAQLREVYWALAHGGSRRSADVSGRSAEGSARNADGSGMGIGTGAGLQQEEEEEEGVAGGAAACGPGPAGPVQGATPELLRDALLPAVPHRQFLTDLLDSCAAAGVPVYVVSFGLRDWVLPVSRALFGGRLPESYVYCLPGHPPRFPVVLNKNLWLQDIADRAGVCPHEVVLFDDQKSNVARALAGGYGAMQVHPHRGLHAGLWRSAVCGACGPAACSGSGAQLLREMGRGGHSYCPADACPCPTSSGCVAEVAPGAAASPSATAARQSPPVVVARPQGIVARRPLPRADGGCEGEQESKQEDGGEQEGTRSAGAHTTIPPAFATTPAPKPKCQRRRRGEPAAPAVVAVAAACVSEASPRHEQRAAAVGSAGEQPPLAPNTPTISVPAAAACVVLPIAAL